jgi:hypothetical protein
MGTPHETCADETDTEFAHSRLPLDFYFQEGYLWNKNSVNANVRINIQAVQGLPKAAILDLVSNNKIKRSQPSAAPAWVSRDPRSAHGVAGGQERKPPSTFSATPVV